MDFVGARPKTMQGQDYEAIKEGEETVKAFQITEKNKYRLGSVVAGYYYLSLAKLEKEIVPEEDHFYFSFRLYSDTNVIRAKVGDWVILRPKKYCLMAEHLDEDAFNVRFSVPDPVEKDKVHISKESNDGFE